MTWTELIRAISERTGLPQKDVRSVLIALSEEVKEALLRGETVSVRGLGSWSRTRRQGRVVRSVANRRKMWIGERFRVRFRPTRSLAQALNPDDEAWRSDAYQRAWRLAETLLDDLELYHGDRVPKDISGTLAPDEVERRCREAFGAPWEQVERTWNDKVDEDVKIRFLGLVAQRRWATP